MTRISLKFNYISTHQSNIFSLLSMPYTLPSIKIDHTTKITSITRSIAQEISTKHFLLSYNTDIQPSHNQHLHFILFQFKNNISIP